MDWRENPLTASRAHAEEPVEFAGSAGRLYGIFTPADPAARRGQPCVIFPGRPRFAFSRMPVMAARILAAEGFAALRFDLHGSGESEGPTDISTRYNIYGADVAAAMRFLRETRGAERFFLVGYCFDALCALDAFRLEGGAIDGLFFASAPVTEVKFKDPDLTRIARAAANPRKVVAQLTQPGQLKKRAARLLRRLQAPPDVSGRSRIEPNIEAGFRALIGSRARALFVYGEDEPLREEFRAAEQMFAGLDDEARRRLLIEIWPRPVHNIDSHAAIFERAVVWVRESTAGMAIPAGGEERRP